MTRLKISRISGTAAMLGSALALASPALGQAVVQYPGACSQMYPNANCVDMGPGNPFTGSYQRNRDYWDSRANLAWYGRPWVGTPPGVGDDYGGYAGDPLARVSCAPGTWFRGPDGHRHRCR